MSTDPAVVEEVRWSDRISLQLPRWSLGLALLSVISLVLQHGFPVGQRMPGVFNAIDVIFAIGFAAAIGISIRLAKHRHEAVRAHRFELVLLATSLAALVVGSVAPERIFSPLLSLFHQQGMGGLLLGVVRLYVLGNVLLQILRLLQRIFVAGVRPEVVFALSFVALILIGTLLLLMPRVSAKPHAPITVTEAFFTSTSAVCVTGLGVRDTGTDFSNLGQFIILALIQVGGLGIVTFVALV